MVALENDTLQANTGGNEDAELEEFQTCGKMMEKNFDMLTHLLQIFMLDNRDVYELERKVPPSEYVCFYFYN